jgi:hypothetical protein
LLARAGPKDQLNGLGKFRHDRVRRFPQRLAVAAVDQDGAAPRGSGAIDVTPAVADHVTAVKIDPQYGGGGEKHTRRRFSTGARFAVLATGMETNLDPIEHGQGRQEFRMHLLDLRARLRSAAHIRLIRHHDKKKSGGFQPCASLRDIVIQLEIGDVGRWVRTTVAHNWTIEHSVAIEENRALLYLVLSHFVCVTLSFG